MAVRSALASLEVIDRAQLEVAGSLGERPWGVLRRIVLPGHVSALIAGGSWCCC